MIKLDQLANGKKESRSITKWLLFVVIPFYSHRNKIWRTGWINLVSFYRPEEELNSCTIFLKEQLGAILEWMDSGKLDSSSLVHKFRSPWVYSEEGRVRPNGKMALRKEKFVREREGRRKPMNKHTHTQKRREEKKRGKSSFFFFFFSPSLMCRVCCMWVHTPPSLPLWRR